MFRPAVPALRTAFARSARPALSPPRPLALPPRASASTRKPTKKATFIIPPEAYWRRTFEIFRDKEWFHDKTADPNEYHRIVQNWQLAQSQNSTNSRQMFDLLKTDINTFRKAAVFLSKVYTPGLSRGPEARLRADLALSMLSYASYQGCPYATAYYFSMELNLKGVAGNRPPVLPQDMRDRLYAMMDATRLPILFLVAARIAAHDGDDPRADSLAAYGIQVMDDGLRDPADVRWADDLFILRGHIKFRAGDAEGARSFFREAVRRYDSRDAALELVYDGECPEAVRLLMGHAVMGLRHDCLKLSDGEGDFAVKMLERGEKQRFQDHQFIAQEWLKLSRTKDADMTV